MIVEWLVAVGTSMGNTVVGLFPSISIPAGIQNLDDGVNGLLNSTSGLGVWLDLPTIGILAAVPAAVWGLGMTFKGFRMLLSHLPFVGGR